MTDHSSKNAPIGETDPSCLVSPANSPGERVPRGDSLPSLSSLGSGPSDPSLVHTLETSARSQLCLTYRAYRAQFCEKELAATMDLYTQVDARDGKDRSAKLDGCRSYAWFAYNLESGSVKVLSNSCRLRWCPICSAARQVYVKKSVSEFILRSDHPKFFTVTFKHSSAPLDHQIKNLYKFYRLLRQRKEFKDKVTGGLWFFQVKRSKGSGEWHPHIHSVLTGKYISHRVLSKLWLDVTKSSCIVDIRAIRDENKVSEYVSRYTSRPAVLDHFDKSDQLEIFDALHGRRLCGTWGKGNIVSFRQPKMDDKTQWEFMGRYDTVVKLSESNARAKAILKAWLKNHPLPHHLRIPDAVSEYKKWTTLCSPDVGMEDLYLDSG